MKNILEKIDYKLLRKQRKTLDMVMHKLKNNTEFAKYYADLDGLRLLLDCVQDSGEGELINYDLVRWTELRASAKDRAIKEFCALGLLYTCPIRKFAVTARAEDWKAPKLRKAIASAVSTMQFDEDGGIF